MVYEKIRDIISIQFNIDKQEITMKTDFRKDLGADSIDLVELIMSLEEEFDLEVEDEEVENINTVEDAVEYINNILD